MRRLITKAPRPSRNLLRVVPGGQWARVMCSELALLLTACGPIMEPFFGADPAAEDELASVDASSDVLAAGSAHPPFAAASPARGGDSRVPGIDCLTDPAGIRRKLLVHLEQTPILREPDGPASSRVADVFQPYFLFAAEPAEQRPLWFQIGTTPREESILGWVQASRAVEWSTRVGARQLVTDDGLAVPLLVYPDLQDLVELVTTGDSDAARPIARAGSMEDEQRSPWPIIEVHTEEVDGQVFEFNRLQFLGQFDADRSAAAQTFDERRRRLREQRDLDGGLRAEEVNEVMELLRDHGDVHLASLGPERVACSTGWVLASVDGSPAMQKMVWLARSELDYLMFQLQEVVSSLAPRAAEPPLSIADSSRTGSFMDESRPATMRAWLQARGVPCHSASILDFTPTSLFHSSQRERSELRERISRSVLPQLLSARNSDLFRRIDGIDWGWMTESILP